MGPAVTFGLLPGLGAAGAAGLLRNAVLSGAAGAGLWALVFVAPMIPAGPLLFFGLPVIFGAAIGATVAGIMLAIRPSVSVWTRMTVALVIGTLAGLALLSTAFGGT